MEKKMTNRQLAALETKRKLLEAAKKLVCEKGLVNTSIEEITKACGVSNGTFYTYFKRKEDVVFALSQEMYQGIYEEAQAHDGPFMERLVFYMVNFSGHIERDGLKLCQEWVRNTIDPDLVEAPYNKDKLRVDIDSMKGMIEKGIERGELKKSTPVDALANALVDVIYGEMLCWDMSGGAYTFEERTKEFCKTGLTKQEKTTDIWFDEKDPLIHIRTHNTDLKKRLAAYAGQHPDQCRQTDADPETGCMEFEIAKGRFSFRLTAPYSAERREAARRYARENNAADRLK